MLQLYEDYIFGKIYTKPYNEEVMHKRVLLEHIYVDLWGLSLNLSAGGAHYFMIIINSVFPFQYINFLRKMTTEMTLDIL